MSLENKNKLFLKKQTIGKNREFSWANELIISIETQQIQKLSIKHKNANFSIRYQLLKNCKK